ncbi:MAG: hypothetical protein F6J89_00420 [Symploca sp. SIO1C4]|uniref:Uncharacterized protein n=1 Tax=Symploca sp. SIO1C4 TaxID=2607765 RepID=A0A6B3N973_9CYAN|nr:hypothetical protein [Symploca sp. SIO1C4]
MKRSYPEGNRFLGRCALDNPPPNHKYLAGVYRELILLNSTELGVTDYTNQP